MAKLVILSEGMTGRSHELTVEKTTIGRVEDNTFPIVDTSVSSHHCEVLLRGNEVLVRDTGSTNGTFIEGEKISESVLKPGQVLRVGQIQMRLEGGPAAALPGVKKGLDSTIVMQRGVSLNELEQGRAGGFDTAGQGFSKKTNKANRIFLYISIVVAVLIVVLLVIAFMGVEKH
jgi:pSer/pThr/pTyr-binding forkhead associated (FHA) protein